MLKKILICIAILALLFNLGWSAKTKTAPVEQPVKPKQHIHSPSTDLVDKKPETLQSPQPTSPEAFAVPWHSVNAGGSVNMTSTNFGMKASLGQSVIGFDTSTNYKMGIGFWYGAGGSACLAQPGDVNGTPPIGLPDVIHLVNYVFDKDRPASSCLGSDPGNCWTPDPLCRGEVNGTPPIGLPDVIHLVNYVFDKDRPATSCLGTDPGNCWPPVPSDVCCL